MWTFFFFPIMLKPRFFYRAIGRAVILAGKVGTPHTFHLTGLILHFYCIVPKLTSADFSLLHFNICHS